MISRRNFTPHEVSAVHDELLPRDAGRARCHEEFESVGYACGVPIRFWGMGPMTAARRSEC